MDAKDRFTSDEAEGEIAKDWGLKPPRKSDTPNVSRTEAVLKSGPHVQAAPDPYVKLVRLTKSKYNRFEGLAWLVAVPNALDAEALPECERPLNPGGGSVGEPKPSPPMTVALVPADREAFQDGQRSSQVSSARCRIVAEPGWPHRIDYVSMMGMS